MIDEVRSQIRQCNCVLVDGLHRLAFVAVAIAAWLTASTAHLQSIAVAAEVDAIGVRAPLDFADVVERVKPAVVGVRVRIEGVMTSDEPQKEGPLPPRSPFDRFFRHFGIPIPDAPFLSQDSRWDLDSSSLETAISLPIITLWPTERASRLPPTAAKPIGPR